MNWYDYMESVLDSFKNGPNLIPIGKKKKKEKREILKVESDTTSDKTPIVRNFFVYLVHSEWRFV